MRAGRLKRFVAASPDPLLLQLQVLVTVVASQIFYILASWFPGPPLLWDQTITPEMLDPDWEPWVGILGWLPILPTLLVALVLWSVLLMRRLTQANYGIALVACAYGLFSRNVGAFGSFLTGPAADPMHAPFGKVLVYASDCALILGFAYWVVMTVVGLRRALRQRRHRAQRPQEDKWPAAAASMRRLRGPPR